MPLPSEPDKVLLSLYCFGPRAKAALAREYTATAAPTHGNAVASPLMPVDTSLDNVGPRVLAIVLPICRPNAEPSGAPAPAPFRPPTRLPTKPVPTPPEAVRPPVSALYNEPAELSKLPPWVSALRPLLPARPATAAGASIDEPMLM